MHPSLFSFDLLLAAVTDATPSAPSAAPGITVSSGLAALWGVLLGVLLGLVYVHLAWYFRDNDGEKPSKNIKLRVLVAIVGQNGAVWGLTAMLKTEFATQVVIFANIACMGTSVLAVFAIMVLGFLYAYTSQPLRGTKLRAGLKGLSIALFEGPKDLEAKVAENSSSIHEKSKLALAELNIETEQAMLGAADAPKTRLQFSKHFTALVGFTLHGFFQHSTSEHPDYCGCYYKFNPEDGLFYPVAVVSGSDHYAVSRNPRLGKDSLAYRCLNEGRVVAWHRGQANGRLSPNPPLSRKKLERFICVPVPPGENLDVQSRRGVLCVDSSKPGTQFTDSFHCNVLLWLAYKLAELDRMLLVNEQEWKTKP